MNAARPILASIAISWLGCASGDVVRDGAAAAGGAGRGGASASGGAGQGGATSSSGGGAGQGGSGQGGAASSGGAGQGGATSTSTASGGAGGSACVPSCNLPCADDGCGGVCETCGAGRACVGGACACDPKLPPSWPASFAPYAHNPVLVPSKQASLQGADNVYAPELVRKDGLVYLFYGGQGGDGHDRVYLAWSSDGFSFQKWPSGAAPAPVLDVGGSNHVNDPSVVFDGASWRMYYTDAGSGIDDRVWLAEGASPTSFAKVGEVIGVGAPGSWESVRVGRPAVILDNGTWRLWYDGAGPSGRHVGYAESKDGVNFTKHPQNPVLLNAGAVDVKKVGDVFVLLHEGGDGTHWATSVDGLCWVDRGLLFPKSGAAYDAYGQVTPFLDVVNGSAVGVYFGGASAPTWDKNRVAVAPAAGVVPPAAGCTGCLAPGVSCGEACAAGGNGDSGSCGAPGSVDPGACCACADDGCAGCLAAGTTCHAACVAAGHALGFCANPGSHDPAACCGCL